MTQATECPLCLQPGGRVLWQNELFRVIDPEDLDYPGLTRIIWQNHVREMTDLDPASRDVLMQAVWTVESAQRAALEPDKINIASLGNIVPHLHWHIIPRWRDDKHFPDSIWSPPRQGPAGSAGDGQRALRTDRLPHYWQTLLLALNALAA